MKRTMIAEDSYLRDERFDGVDIIGGGHEGAMASLLLDHAPFVRVENVILMHHLHQARIWKSRSAIEFEGVLCRIVEYGDM